MRPLASWDDISVGILKQSYADGYSAGAISKVLIAKGYPFTRNAVIGKKNRLQLPPPKTGVTHKHLKRQKAVSVIRATDKPKFVWHRKPQSLGAHASMENRKMKEDNVTGSNAVLLTQSKDGQCRAIIGYENGELGRAIICGDPTPAKLIRGRYVTGSWCAHHNELYTQEDRPRR